MNGDAGNVEGGCIGEVEQYVLPDGSKAKESHIGQAGIGAADVDEDGGVLCDIFQSECVGGVKLGGVE